mgnify:CR=1 FL=1
MENGITDSNELHARNKKTMLERANCSILAVDSSKFGYTAFTSIGGLENISMIVTDEEPIPKQVLGTNFLCHLPSGAAGQTF